MAVHLVCEGGNNGLDNRVLDRLVIQAHNLSVQRRRRAAAAALVRFGSTC